MKQAVRRALLCCVLGVLLAVPAFADTTWRLEELGMEITLPDDCEVLTRDDVVFPEDDTVLEAWYPELNLALLVTMVPEQGMEVPNISTWGDTMLTSMSRALREKYEAMGARCGDVDLYDHRQVKFIRTPYVLSQDGVDVHLFDYYTILNSQHIHIAMQSDAGEIGPRAKEALRAAVDTVRFDHVPETDVQPARTPAFTYTDRDAGITFTVPENWSSGPVEEPGAGTSASFFFNSDPMVSIQFWSMPLGRDMEQGSLTLQQAAALFRCETGEVESILLGGREYYRYQQTIYQEIYGMELPFPSLQFLCVENGSLHTFQLVGAEQDSPRYRDFLALLQSARYRDAGSAWERALPFVYLLLAAAVCVLPALFYRYVLHKAPVPPAEARKMALVYGGAVLACALLLSLSAGRVRGISVPLWSWVHYRVLTAAGVKRCRLCGAALHPDGRFCGNCGAPIPGRKPR